MKSTAEDDELIELYRGGHWKRFLAGAVLKRKTMIICGTNASGKTHISKACLDAVPRDERLITIEDAPELRGLDERHPNSVSLYYDKDSKGGVPHRCSTAAASPPAGDGRRTRKAAGNCPSSLLPRMMSNSCMVSGASWIA